MAEFFEYDPFTGIKTETAWSESEQAMTLIRTADVEPVLDHAKASANRLGKDPGGIKSGWMRYAMLPPIVILQLRAKGINVFDKNDSEAMLREINSNYPHLKTVTGNEGKKTRVFA